MSVFRRAAAIFKDGERGEGGGTGRSVGSSHCLCQHAVPPRWTDISAPPAPTCLHPPRPLKVGVSVCRSCCRGRGESEGVLERMRLVEGRRGSAELPLCCHAHPLPSTPFNTLNIQAPTALHSCMLSPLPQPMLPHAFSTTSPAARIVPHPFSVPVSFSSPTVLPLLTTSSPIFSSASHVVHHHHRC